MDSQEFCDEICTICKKEYYDGNPPIRVYAKGLKTIIRSSLKRKMTQLHDDLLRMQRNDLQVLVHQECRKTLTDSRKKITRKPYKRLRSSEERPFEWKNYCFLCSEIVELRHLDRSTFNEAMTFTLRERLVARATERNDEWGNLVLKRVH